MLVDWGKSSAVHKVAMSHHLNLLMLNFHDVSSCKSLKCLRAGSPPWFSPELARMPRAPIGSKAYTALLRAVLTAWQQEADAAEGLLQRLHFAEYLRDILQVCTYASIVSHALFVALC
jgi:hypothetical protein